MKQSIVWIMVFLLTTTIVSATELIVSMSEFEGQLEIINIKVIEENIYYESYYQDYSKRYTSYEMVFLNEERDIIFTAPVLNILFTKIDYDLVWGAKELAILRSGNPILEYPLEFCNNNDMCEPCLRGICESFENELSCSDCEPSSEDGFCNIADDGICDPDCKGYEYDIPPEYDYCYEERIYHAGCGFYELPSCEEGYFCNGREIILEGSGEICCTGKCEIIDMVAIEAPVDEELDTKVEKENYLPIILAVSIILFMVMVLIIKTRVQKTK